MADVRLDTAGRIVVTGDLLFDDAVAACAAGRALLDAAPAGRVEVSLGGLARINSVSAVVLIEWQRAALKAGRQLAITDVPPRLAGMLRLTGLDTVLPLAS